MSEKKHRWKQDGKPVSRKMALLILGPALLILLGGGFYLLGDRYITTDNAYMKAKKTSISAEVSGKIIKVNIADNARVKEGDELFQIDPEPFQIAVNRAEANMNNVRAEIESMRSDYLQKVAELARAEESMRYRESEHKRYKDLAEKMAISREKSYQANHDFNASEKERDAAKQEAEATKAKLGGDDRIATEEHPNFKQAKADLEKAQLELSRVTVTAPSDGIAANVTMEPGEFTAAGLPLFILVNDHALWIEANFKETDLTHVHPGQDAEIEVDTYPGVTWHAKVVSITPATGSEFSILPAQNSSGNWVKVVQRIMVRLELVDNNANLSLASGMSARVTVDTGASRLARLFGVHPDEPKK
ncbi:MAG: secretion protein HlyD family protein [Rickettsiales bacterium]|jgi:membrane fusion protein (multidrug efflux system)|nr:secretion protein HlyD family protein [Rickettsiales bacterium]